MVGSGSGTVCTTVCETVLRIEILKAPPPRMYYPPIPNITEELFLVVGKASLIK